jgi:Ceramidase
MDWLQAIDLYCERTGPAFWAEPANAMSNAAFLVAAAYALRQWSRAGSRDWPALALIIIVAIIGIGSFLFHTFANRWSLLADVIPIQLFMLGMFGIMLHRLLLWPLAGVVAGTIAFLACGFLAPRLALFLGFGASAGAAFGYGTGLVAMLVLGGWAVVAMPQPKRETGWTLLTAAAVFAVSLTLRQLDQRLCDALPLGTHFLWHILNAQTLGLLLAATIRLGPARTHDQPQHSPANYRP